MDNFFPCPDFIARTIKEMDHFQCQLIPLSLDPTKANPKDGPLSMTEKRILVNLINFLTQPRSNPEIDDGVGEKVSLI